MTDSPVATFALGSELFWPPSHVGEALEVLARRAGLLHPSVSSSAVAPPSPAVIAAPSMSRWLLDAAERVGVEAESVKVTHASLRAALERMGPALWRVPLAGGSCFLVLLRAHRHLGRAHMTLIATDGRARRVSLAWLERLLCHGDNATGSARQGVQGVLLEAGLSKARQAATLHAIMDDALANTFVEGGVVLRPHPAASFAWQARRAGALVIALQCALAHGLHYALFLAAWALFAQATLAGWLDGSWLLACGLLLSTSIPLRLAASSASGRLSLALGRLLKQRLLYSTFRLEPDVVRQQGTGELFARTVEAERIESLSLSGGIAVVLAVIELAFVAFILAAGAAPLAHLVLLCLFCAGVAAVAVRAHGRRSTWMRSRLALTGQLVERMAGHRTRLAQQAPARWHDGEDEALVPYVAASLSVDRSTVEASAWLGRAFMPIALLALLPVLATGDALVAIPVVVSLGGILLGAQSFARLTQGLFALVDAAVAWHAVRPLLEGQLRRRTSPRHPAEQGQAGTDAARADDAAILDARALSFAHAGRATPVLHACDLSIRRGDRILLEGPSGGGKSTLTSLLSCLRRPTSGSLLLHGLDAHTLGGASWRRAVACVPQLQENHVLTGTFAYNALLGRGWPASEQDLDDVKEVCGELGLADLLARMPAGLHQMVGESGWRLSHGEKSRLFLARALLQSAELVLLDETFAALDPDNLERALACALRRAPALVVVAHP